MSEQLASGDLRVFMDPRLIVNVRQHQFRMPPDAVHERRDAHAYDQVVADELGFDYRKVAVILHQCLKSHVKGVDWLSRLWSCRRNHRFLYTLLMRRTENAVKPPSPPRLLFRIEPQLFEDLPGMVECHNVYESLHLYPAAAT